MSTFRHLYNWNESKMEQKTVNMILPKTSSRFNFMIENWPNALEIYTPGQSIQSSIFTIPNDENSMSRFCLQIFPNGINEECRGYVSCRLVNITKQEKRASIVVSIMKYSENANDMQNEEIAKYCNKHDEIKLFQATGLSGSSWDIPKLISHEKLTEKEANYVMFDAIGFVVDITIFGDMISATAQDTSTARGKLVATLNESAEELKEEESNAESVPYAEKTSVRQYTQMKPSTPKTLYRSKICLGNAPLPASKEYLQTLNDHIVSLYNNEIHSDLTLCCGDIHLFTHKAILAARSPVFKEKFTQLPFNFQVAMSGGKYFMTKIKEPLVLKEFVKFIYTDACSTDVLDQPPMVKELYELGKKYEMPGLTALCEDHMVDCLTPETLLSFYTYACSQEDEHFKQRCADFVRINANIFHNSALMDEFDETLKGVVTEVLVDDDSFEGITKKEIEAAMSEKEKGKDKGSVSEVLQPSIDNVIEGAGEVMGGGEGGTKVSESMPMQQPIDVQ